MDNSTHKELMRIIKVITKKKVVFPEIGNQITYNAISKNLENERFSITINRKCHKREDNLIYLLNSKRYQLVLRLDMLGPTHENNDGSSIDTPHLHIYNERYREGREAVPLAGITDTLIIAELMDSLLFFLEYINIDVDNLELPMI